MGYFDSNVVARRYLGTTKSGTIIAILTQNAANEYTIGGMNATPIQERFESAWKNQNTNALPTRMQSACPYQFKEVIVLMIKGKSAAGTPACIYARQSIGVNTAAMATSATVNTNAIACAMNTVSASGSESVAMRFERGIPVFLF